MPYSESTSERLQIRIRIPQLFGLLAFAIGLVDLLSLTLPFVHGFVVARLVGIPGITRGPAILTTFFASLALMLIADGLARRKRRAFWVTVVLLSVVILDRVILYRQDLVGIFRVIVPLALLVALMSAKSLFNARPAPQSWRHTFSVVSFIVFAVGSSSLLVVLNRLHELHRDWSWSIFGSEGLPGLIGIITPLTSSDNAGSDLTYFALVGLGLGLIIPVFYVTLRSHKPLGRCTPEDATELRALYDSSQIVDSLSYFSLRDDVSLCWSSDRRSCIVFRVEFGVALASGDPIGDVESWPDAMESYVRMAHSYGWLVAVMSASEFGAHMWCEHQPFVSLQIGDEAVVDTSAFTLEGRAMKNARNAVTRTKRRGYSVEVHRLCELSLEECRQLSRLSTDWRVGDTERGFSMALGRVDQERDPQIIAVRAFVQGELHGFMTFIPWGTEGLSLDFMRRHPQASNGVNELMLSELIGWAHEHGIGKISLNFTTFRKLLEQGASDEATALTTLGRKVLLVVSKFIQVETLHRFNSKFGPEWQPRYLVFEARREFIRAGLAALAAEGFL